MALRYHLRRRRIDLMSTCEWVLQNNTFSGQTKSGKDDSYGCMFSIYYTYLLLGKWQKLNIFQTKNCAVQKTQR